MRVVLVKTDDNLGLIGEEIEVKSGHARNWLIPQKIAVFAHDKKEHAVIKEARKERHKLIKNIEALKKIALELSEKVVVIKAKAGESGKLFGSVTGEDIAKELKLDKKDIEFQPIKDVGIHEVQIKLGFGVNAKTKINVVAVNEPKKTETKKKTIKK